MQAKDQIQSEERHPKKRGKSLLLVVMATCSDSVTVTSVRPLHTPSLSSPHPPLAL